MKLIIESDGRIKTDLKNEVWMGLIRYDNPSYDGIMDKETLIVKLVKNTPEFYERRPLLILNETNTSVNCFLFTTANRSDAYVVKYPESTGATALNGKTSRIRVTKVVTVDKEDLIRKLGVLDNDDIPGLMLFAQDFGTDLKKIYRNK